MRRREFIRNVAAGAAIIWLRPRGLSAKEPAPVVKIDEPFDGAVLNRRHGKQTADGLRIRVRGTAPAGWRVSVNGVAASRSGRAFEAVVMLRKRETVLSAAAKGVQEVSRARVVWDRRSFRRYRFVIDDNSFFLRDIARKQYKSLFDCLYLDALRKLHRKYRAKFVLNIYYTTGKDFNLTQFPDRYKAQWKDNAGWLRLAFHARADKPVRPYQDAEPKKLIADLDQVAEQIVRFAGKQVYTPPTVIHWGMTRPSAFKPLYQRGVRVLSGYFRKDARGRWDVNYRLPDRVSEHLSRHDAWKDFDSGIVFSRVDIVCNSVSVAKTVPQLAPLTKDPNTAEIMDLLTHEQPFWPYNRPNFPDHVRRLDTAIRFVTEQGYKPVFYHEGFLGAPV